MQTASLSDTLSPDTATHCTQCRARLDDGRVTHARVAYYNAQHECFAVLCVLCDRERTVQRYLANKLLTPSLMVLAAIADTRRPGDSASLPPQVSKFYNTHAATLAAIHTQVSRLTEKVRAFEQRHWIDGLQVHYRNSPLSTMSGDADYYTACLLGSAGRALLTLSDRFSERDMRSKFGGCHITMIFAYNKKSCTGGIQGISGTYDQVMSLLDAAYACFPQLWADARVGLGL